MRKGSSNDPNSVHLLLDSPADLWCLQTLISPGDLIRAKTTRTAESTGDKVREGKAPKVTMTLTIAVEQVEWHGFSDALRLLGPIHDGPQDLGKYHTLAFQGDRGEDLTVTKPQGWATWESGLLEERLRDTKVAQALVLAIDDEEAQFSTIAGFGTKHLGSLPAGGQGKRMGDPEAAKKKFYALVLQSLETLRTPKDLPTLVVGPGWWREEFLSYAKSKQPDLVAGIGTEGTSQGGRAGIQEAIRQGAVARLAEDQRVSAETELMEQVYVGLAKGAGVAVGLAEVQQALQAGAVSQLAVLDEVTKKDEIREFLRTASHAGASVLVVSGHHTAGEQLAGIGGVAALLRFEF